MGVVRPIAQHSGGKSRRIKKIKVFFGWILSSRPAWDTWNLKKKIKARTKGMAHRLRVFAALAKDPAPMIGDS